MMRTCWDASGPVVCTERQRFRVAEDLRWQGEIASAGRDPNSFRKRVMQAMERGEKRTIRGPELCVIARGQRSQQKGTQHTLPSRSLSLDSTTGGGAEAMSFGGLANIISSMKLSCETCTYRPGLYRPFFVGDNPLCSAGPATSCPSAPISLTRTGAPCRTAGPRFCAAPPTALAAGWPWRIWPGFRGFLASDAEPPASVPLPPPISSQLLIPTIAPGPRYQPGPYWSE